MGDLGALSGSREPSPASGLGPSGFNPARVRRDSWQRQFETVAERWKKQYFRNGQWGSTADATYVKLCAAKTLDDLKAIGLHSWVAEACDLCGCEPEQWLEIGDNPDYDARFLYVCLPCAQHLGAIAMEARQGGDAKQAPSASANDSARPQDIAQHETP